MTYEAFSRWIRIKSLKTSRFKVFISIKNEEISQIDHWFASLRLVYCQLRYSHFVTVGYAIENVWVTMLMITQNLPNTIDSFIWILPIIIAIFVRPFLVRYVHGITFRVYREISLVSFFLVLGALGCFLVGHSCQMTKKTEVRDLFM